jgi:hypothetical protein
MAIFHSNWVLQVAVQKVAVTVSPFSPLDTLTKDNCEWVIVIDISTAMHVAPIVHQKHAGSERKEKGRKKRLTRIMTTPSSVQPTCTVHTALLHSLPTASI